MLSLLAVQHDNIVTSHDDCAVKFRVHDMRARLSTGMLPVLSVP